MSARALALLVTVLAASVAGAQGTPTKSATKSAGTRPAAAAPQGTKSADTKGQTKAPGQGGARTRPETVVEAPPVIMREVFEYDDEGRRDPYVSLLVTNDLRPTLQELRLVSILFDETGRRSIAVMRDEGKTQYRVTTGMTLGRMRVALITRRSVIFSIEEFGLNRTDSLVLSTNNRTVRQ